MHAKLKHGDGIEKLNKWIDDYYIHFFSSKESIRSNEQMILHWYKGESRYYDQNLLFYKNLSQAFALR